MEKTISTNFLHFPFRMGTYSHLFLTAMARPERSLKPLSLVNCKVAYMSIDILTKCAYSAKIKLNGLFSKKHLPHSLRKIEVISQGKFMRLYDLEYTQGAQHKGSF